MSLSAITSGAVGMHRAAERLDASATRIARFGTGRAETDLATELVETAMAETAFKAAASVVRTADRMARTTIDILA